MNTPRDSGQADLLELLAMAGRALQPREADTLAGNTCLRLSQSQVERISRERLSGFLLAHAEILNLDSNTCELLSQDRKTRLEEQLNLQLGTHIVSRILRNASIPHLFFKGWALSSLLGAEDELRGGGDVDVLIRPRDIVRARETLEKSGFSALYPVQPRTFWGWKFITYRNRELPFRSNTLELDLHWRIGSEPSMMASAEMLLSRAMTVETGHHTIVTLSRADTLAAAAYHFFLDYGVSLRQLIDFARLVPLTDPQALHELPPHARQIVADVLALCDELFGRRHEGYPELPRASTGNVEYLQGLFWRESDGDMALGKPPSKARQSVFVRNYRHLRHYSDPVPLFARLIARGVVWFPRATDHPGPVGLLRAFWWQLGRLLIGRTKSHI